MSDRAVWKFSIPVNDEWTTLPVPEGARLVGAASQFSPSSVEVWFDCDTGAAAGARTFIIVGTGHPVPEDAGDHVGMAMALNNTLVWHIFEKAEAHR